MTLMGAMTVLAMGSLGLGKGENATPVDSGDPTWQAARVTANRLLSSGMNGKPKIISGGGTRQKIAYLTFDDGPHRGKTDQLVKTLRDLKCPAAFFVIGKMAERDPWDVMAIQQAGFVLGNHSFSHPDLSKLNDLDILAEYVACNDVIKRITGEVPRFCRPPGGRESTKVNSIAGGLGMATVNWTDDPGDYVYAHKDLPANAPRDLLSKLKRQLHPGGIILLHDGIPLTVQILPQFVGWARQQGYTFMPLGQP